MKTIRVGFSTTYKFNLADYMIRKTIDEEFSHTYIVMDEDVHSVELVHEATFIGVHTTKYEEWLPLHKVILEVELQVSDERYEQIKKFVESVDGASYGFWQLLRIYLDWDYYDNGNFRFICSELMARALYVELGYGENDRLDMITPKDIYYKVIDLITDQSNKNIKKFIRNDCEYIC